MFLNNILVTQNWTENISAQKNSVLELLIIQSKYTTSFGKDAIMKLKTVSTNLLDLSHSLTDFSSRYNEDVLESFKTFKDTYTKLITSRVKLKFRFFYATLAAEANMNVQQQASENKQCLENESRLSRDRIIFATNNQTNIPKSSLRVTDPIHLQIEMYFKSRTIL